MSAKPKLDRRGFLTRGLAIAGATLAGGCDSGFPSSLGSSAFSTRPRR